MSKTIRQKYGKKAFYTYQLSKDTKLVDRVLKFASRPQGVTSFDIIRRFRLDKMAGYRLTAQLKGAGALKPTGQKRKYPGEYRKISILAVNPKWKWTKKYMAKNPKKTQRARKAA